MRAVNAESLLKELERHTKRCNGLVHGEDTILCEKCGLRIYQGEAPTIETKGALIEVS
jgi:hypothetical protein